MSNIVNKDVPVTIIDVINKRSIKKKSIHLASVFLNIKMDKLIPWFKRSISHPIRGSVTVKVDQEKFDESWSMRDYVYVYDHVDQCDIVCREGFQLACKTGLNVNEVRDMGHKKDVYYKAGFTIAKTKELLDNNKKVISITNASIDRDNYYSKERTKEKLDPVINVFSKNNKTFNIQIYNYSTNEVSEYNNIITLASSLKVLKERAQRAIDKCLETGESVLINGYGLKTTLNKIPWKKYNEYQIYCSVKGLAITTALYVVSNNSNFKQYFKLGDILNFFTNIEKDEFMFNSFEIGNSVVKVKDGVMFTITRVN